MSITERCEPLAIAAEHLAAAFTAAAVPMALLDGEGRAVAANAALYAMVDEVTAVSVGANPQARAAYAALLRGQRDRLRFIRRFKNHDGTTSWLRATVTPVRGTAPCPEGRNADLDRETYGDPARPQQAHRAVLTAEDVTEQRELRQRLRHLRMHDPLTRLPNRALFFERLSGALHASDAPEDVTGPEDRAGTVDVTAPEEVAGKGTADATGTVFLSGTGTADATGIEPRSGDGGSPGGAALRQAAGGRIGVCHLDLDGFKAVNDTLGHRIGDRLLMAVAERLVMCAQPMGHLVARLGGDEFALLVEDSRGTGQVTAIADAVMDALAAPFDIEGHHLTVSASVGVVERPVEGTSATCLMQAADTTLYWAKADGKARWTLFDPERNAHRMTRQTLSSTLRSAVERGQFVVEYQPLVGIGDGALRGVEALVRWRHPQLGTLTPDRFIPLAEENGAIVPLGRWVLAESCRQARRWQLEHPDAPPFVSVNVAVRQVWDSDLVADVAGILEETRLPARLLQLELTESAVMGSAGRPLQALHALSEMGVRIAIDDFGTGYSNLAYLSRLPVRGLKLDGTFVRGFGADSHPNPADETIVTALIQLAHQLGLTVTAECVESAEQAERLRAIGCDNAQGWFYSKAASAERIDTMLRGAARLPSARADGHGSA